MWKGDLCLVRSGQRQVTALTLPLWPFPVYVYYSVFCFCPVYTRPLTLPALPALSEVEGSDWKTRRLTDSMTQSASFSLTR